jgi:hypothetical protein
MVFRVPWPDDGPDDYLQNVRWLEIPVTGISNIANCYLSGTGFAFFDIDPPWGDGFTPSEFRFTFRAQSPLRADDVPIPGATLATVALCHVVRDNNTEWTLALGNLLVQTEFVTINGQTSGLIVVDIGGGYEGDCFMKGIAFQVGLLVYRPSLQPHQPKYLPRKIPLSEILQVAGILPLQGGG